MASCGVSIRPSCTVFFNVPERSKELLRPEDNRAKGGRKSMMRARRVLEFFWLFAKDCWGYGKDENKRFRFKIAFITLTLSGMQMHTDDFIKCHLLEPFLKWAFREGKDLHYVWKAETQDNGNIHFHISFNGFIHYLKIRQKWNHLQWKHGYISADTDPNSTDVHSVRQTAGFVSYMTKYMTKVEEVRKSFNPSACIHPATGALERELMYGGIAATNVPLYKRSIEGKSWACDRKLLSCNAKLLYHDTDPEDQRTDACEKLQEVYNDHLKAMKCVIKKVNGVSVWCHDKDITVNTQLNPIVADLFSAAYRQYIGLS